MESHLEARLWNDVFVSRRMTLGIAARHDPATVLIETILAAFEMDEILYELRDHSAGLNCGRWDYIFSFIKKFRNDSGFLSAGSRAGHDDRPFLQSYALLLIKTCHRRKRSRDGRHGGADSDQERSGGERRGAGEGARGQAARVKAGHDGTWVAHPGLVPIAMEAFDRVHEDKPNQIAKQREDVHVTAKDLLDFRPEARSRKRACG